MPADDITREISAVVTYAPFADKYPALYALLADSAAALIYCRQIIEKTPRAKQTWNVSVLGYEFVKAIDEKFGFNWHFSDNVLSWSSGFFLDKAQNSIAAALDGCVNAWLLSKLPDVEDTEKVERDLLGLWVGIRLRFLSLLVSGKYGKQIRGLWGGFEKYASTEAVEDYIHRLPRRFSNRLEALSLEETPIMFFFKNAKIEEAECISVVFSRVNVFKHRIAGTTDRLGYVYSVEWVITTKALLWLAKFLRSMVADQEIPRTCTGVTV